MRLAEAIDALLVATIADGRSLRTVDSYKEKLSHLLAFLGDVEITTVTAHDLRRYAAAMRQQESRFRDHAYREELPGGLSMATIQGRMTAMMTH